MKVTAMFYAEFPSEHLDRPDEEVAEIAALVAKRYPDATDVTIYHDESKWDVCITRSFEIDPATVASPYTTEPISWKPAVTFPGPPFFTINAEAATATCHAEEAGS